MRLIVDNKAIRKRMIDMDIKNISELSRLSGVSRPKVHEYLGGNTPLASTFIRLCNFLNLDPNDIVSFVNKEDTSNE